VTNSNERTARSESVPVKEEEEKKIRRKKKERVVVSPGSFSQSDEETTCATRALRVLFRARTFGAFVFGKTRRFLDF
jgi:hypothetical protein